MGYAYAHSGFTVVNLVIKLAKKKVHYKKTIKTHSKTNCNAL